MVLLLKILRQLAKHDALYIIEKSKFPKSIIYICKLLWHKPNKKKIRPGQALADALAALGPSFIKLGQALSIRPDLIGKEIAFDLRLLQDSMTPFSGDDAIKRVEAALGKPINKLYSEFNPKAHAAASVAQVHKAVTLDGDKVAVKIIRPGIRKQFQSDIKRFKRLAYLIELFRPKFRKFHILESVEQFEKWSDYELDLRLEAANCAELDRNFSDVDWFKPPEIYWNLSSKDVLTEEWINGVRIDDHKKIKSFGLDPKKILFRSIEAFFSQVFYNGYFHGDIHPGNIFVTPEGVLRPMDFGIMGRVSSEIRQAIANILMGFMTRDYYLVVSAYETLGLFHEQQKREAMANALKVLAEPMLNSNSDTVSYAAILTEIIAMSHNFNLQFESSLLLLNKAMFQAEGTGRLIDPKLNVWLATESHMEKWLIKNRGPKAQIKHIAETLNLGVIELRTYLHARKDTKTSKQKSNKGQKYIFLVAGIFIGFSLGYLFMKLMFSN